MATDWHWLADRANEHLGDRSVDQEADRLTIPLSNLPKDVGPQALCQKCEGMTMEALETKTGYQHHYLEDLMRSAQQCSACSLIQEAICSPLVPHARQNSSFDNPRDAIHDYAMFMARQGLFVAKPTRILLTFESSDQRHGLGLICIGTPLYSAATPPQQKIYAQLLGRLLLHDDSFDNIQPIRPRGSEQDVLDRLAAWLRQREEEVPTSSSKSDEAPLPTRVLDLGEPEPGDLESDLGLKETAGQRGRYATLSYSWGGYRKSRTLKSNYEDQKKGISFQSLPQVFRQAVKVTRGLGIRYLWIDALCIIQEDTEDWSREAARMSEVYWMSAVRLAVTDSTNPTKPFFPPKEFVSVRMPHVQMQEPSLDLESFNMLPKHMLPKTEEEKVALWQKWKEFLSIIPKNLSLSVNEDDEENHQSLAMPFLRRRVVEEIGQSGSRGSTNRLVTRRDGDILKKMPRSVDDQFDVTDARNDQDISDIYERAVLKEEEHEHVDIFTQVPNLPSILEDSWKDAQTSELMEKLKNKSLKMLETAMNPRLKNKDTERPKTTYLSMPRYYDTDVDRGYLNSRGWVLQERLLAPRTIHFTQSHIYCEDTDDICGEDWLRRYLTTASCIRKESSQAQVDLFPERSYVRQNALPGQQRHLSKNFVRNLYWKPKSQHIRRPWHNISRQFNECQLSFDTDRLAAIAGLVHHKSANPKSFHADGRNLCGLWEMTLCLDLAWFCRAKQEAVSWRVLNLGLPSWSWLSYRGSIDFARDAISKLDAGTKLTRTLSTLELVDAQVPDFMEPLPLLVPASLTLRVALRGIYGVSTKITKYGRHTQSREDLAKASPFDFDPRTTTIPVALSSLTECQEIFNEDKRLIGFVAFDEGIHPAGELFCAHISTLTDEAVEAARRDLAEPGVESVDMRQYQRPILAYALVLAKVKDQEDTYTRVGLAEVNYYWMTSAQKVVVKIV